MSANESDSSIEILNKSQNTYLLTSCLLKSRRCIIYIGIGKLAKQNSGNNNTFAIKLLKFKTPEDIDNFNRETNILHALSRYPEIIQYEKIIDLSTNDDKKVLIAMKYYYQTDINNYLLRNCYLLDDILFLSIFFQSLRILKILKMNNVVHNDINFENFIVKSENPFKIILSDFHSAEMIQHGEKSSLFEGTVPYSSPEFLQNKPHDFSSDIWSLGVSFYRLIFKKFPFEIDENDDKETVLEKIMNNELVNHFNLASPDFWEIIVLMLNVDPEERITAEDALKFDCFRDIGYDEKQMAEQISFVVDFGSEIESPAVTFGRPMKTQKKSHISKSSSSPQSFSNLGCKSSSMEPIKIPQDAVSIDKSHIIKSSSSPQSFTNLECKFSSMETIKIPQDVVSIQDWAFALCGSLEKINDFSEQKMAKSEDPNVNDFQSKKTLDKMSQNEDLQIEFLDSKDKPDKMIQNEDFQIKVLNDKDKTIQNKKQGDDTQSKDTEEYDINEYVKYKKSVYIYLLKYLDDKKYEKKLFRLIKTKNIGENIPDLLEFLKLLSSVSKNYHRRTSQSFFKKIEKILLFLDIKQTLSNYDVFKIIVNNMHFLLVFIKNGILALNDFIFQIILEKSDKNNMKYRHFFYPEIQSLLNSEQRKKIENELRQIDESILTSYQKKRDEGENVNSICTLIRKDMINQFIKYVQANKIQLSSKIKKSFFETNSFLIKNNDTTLVEYAAFFGSVKIFQYLIMNNVEINPSIWMYAIHGKKALLLYLLEEKDIRPPDRFINMFLKEAIKCHHNEFIAYFTKSYFNQKINEQLSFCMKHFNFFSFPTDSDNKYIKHFDDICKYNYTMLVDLMLKQYKITICSDKIQSICMENKNIEMGKILLKNKVINQEDFNKILENCFSFGNDMLLEKRKRSKGGKNSFDYRIKNAKSGEIYPVKIFSPRNLDQ